ncbi:MAG: ATP-binding cassette domain-containing protein [Bacteroidales bacterium]
MSESILNALIHLFAIVANIRLKKLTQAEKKIVREYLERHLNQELLAEYLRLFNNYFDFYQRELREDNSTPVENYSLISFQITNVCRQIKKGLLRQERLLVFIQLLELIYADKTVTERELKFIKTVADTFNIEPGEYENSKIFIFEGKPEKIDKERILIIDNKQREWSDSLSWVMRKKTKDISNQPYKHIYKENLYGQLLFLHLESINCFVVRYFGQLSLFVEGEKIIPGHAYFFKSGSIIKGPNISPIYFHDVNQKFLETQIKHKIVFNTYDIEFHFPGSEQGVQRFNVSENSGQLIGVMGSSGVGKSTLLNVLNGNLPLKNGKITINEYNLHHENKELNGLIGYVPQDDLLIEELTVYQNLYFNAKLCFRNFTDEQINEKVNNTLEDLDLLEIKDMIVGNPLKKFISGGQRKRLNIALEWIREPYILFIDEPTTGLSSMDSEKVMYLLKQQILNGCLIIVNIHQPSSEIYKLFDKIWIFDKGGYPVFQGNPVDAVVYFKTVASQINAAESECPHCGNINPEQILKIIEAREIDDYGKTLKKRKTPPETWYERYKSKIEARIKRKEINNSLPSINFNIPSALSQFKIFSKRNLLRKLANRQYVLLNLLEAPILAVILSYFSKYISNEGYVFALNKNLPVFLFMGIIVALFMGLTVSAEEIIKDRRILKRESFLNLSWMSYLNSKVLYLLVLSAIQTFTFVLISNLVLEIQGMLLPFWLILFTTSAFGNLIGLNISSGLNSVITIYILIPLILVPHLLLSGAMIKFDDLHEHITNKKFVPFIGEIMVTRWAYEAIMVKQFKDNHYEKHFFQQDKIISQADYKTSYLIPELEARVKMVERNMHSADNLQKAAKDLQIIRAELVKLHEDADKPPFEYLPYLTVDNINENMMEELNDYLIFLKLHFNRLGQEASEAKRQINQRLVEEYGINWIRELKRNNHNRSVEDFVMNANEINKMYETEYEFIQKIDPIFKEPRSDWGRAHYYAPVKNFQGITIDTFWFNILVIWLGIGVLYYALSFNLLEKILGKLDALIAGLSAFTQNTRQNV